MPVLRLFSSLKFTLLVMAGLGVAALLSYKNPAISTLWVSLPLTILAINLLVVIFTNPIFRQQHGLLIFHIGLLAVILLALMDQMTRFEGRLEVTEGELFDADSVMVVRQGPWHNNQLKQIAFSQNRITVDYAPNVRRGKTRSQILLPATENNESAVLIGDRQSWEAQGYRFLTTFNKGYSLILSWQDLSGNRITGAVNMPSYPLNEWKQENLWSTPAGQELILKLDPGSAPLKDRDWRLERVKASGARLSIVDHGRTTTLVAGESLQLEQGRLRFESVRLWMGYRIDYQPWLIFQFFAAVLAISGLGFHFWKKFSTLNIKQPTIGRQTSGLIHSA